MGIAFFDEQRRAGAVGEAAVRLEILLIVIIVLSFLSFMGGSMSIVYACLSIVIPCVGFYGAWKLKDQYLQIFVIFTAIKIALSVVGAVMTIVTLATFAALKPDTSDNSMFASFSDDVEKGVVAISAVVLIMFIIGAVIAILSLVWAQRLRALIKILPPVPHNPSSHEQLPPGYITYTQSPSNPPPSSSPYPPPSYPPSSYPPSSYPPSSAYPPQQTYPSYAQQQDVVPAYHQNPPPAQV